MCKQNLGVKATSDINSMLIVWTLSDLVLQRPSSLIDNLSNKLIINVTHRENLVLY